MADWIVAHTPTMLDQLWPKIQAAGTTTAKWRIEKKIREKGSDAEVDARKQIEPICNYHTCLHKFSLHNTHRCKCHHALNYAAGIS